MPKQTSLFSFFSSKTDRSELTVLKEKPTTQNSKTSTPTVRTAVKKQSPKSPASHSKSPLQTPSCQSKKSPKSTSAQSKNSQKRKSSVKDTIRQVDAINLDDDDSEIDTVNENGQNSEEDSPVTQRKRRRVQIVESDDEEESMDAASVMEVTPKQTKAKPSKERQSRITNRKATPYVNKANRPGSQSDDDEEEEEEPPKSPVKSRDLSRFEYKKRAKRKERRNISPLKLGGYDLAKKNEALEEKPLSPPQVKAEARKKQNLLDTNTCDSNDKKPSLKETPEQKPSPTTNTSQPVDPSSYDPTKGSYNPRADACWGIGDPVPYSAVALTLQVIILTTRISTTLLVSTQSILFHTLFSL